MGTAIFGLVGVIVGAVVTGGVDLALDKRREGVEKERLKRLVARELQTIWVQLGTTLETRMTPRLPFSQFEGRFFPDQVWLTSQASLANAVTDDQEYLDLAGLYASIDMFRRALDELGPSRPVGANLIQQAKDLREHVEKACFKLVGITLQDESSEPDELSTSDV